jgi:2,3-bisphosphoglycerate-independent phosphoglycerate mutase
MKNNKTKVALIILDGWGLSPPWGGNAVAFSKTPTFEYLWQNFPHTAIYASGEHVGLTNDEPGNSEVGHLTIGAGRILDQSDTRINKEIKNGSFYKNQIFLNAIEHTIKNNSAIHLCGLLSSGKVHSDFNHLVALINLCGQKKVKNIYLDLFSDGRDSPPMSALSLLEKLKKSVNYNYKISSICGRYYAMDRDKRWERTEIAYNAIVNGNGEIYKTPVSAIAQNYSKGKTDEFISSCIVADSEQNAQQQSLQPNDSIIFFNYRPDRIRQLVRSIAMKNFNFFKRKKNLNNLFIATMTPYENDYPIPGVQVVYDFVSNIKHTLAEILSINNLTQLHIAETEKYAHVTYFFNGGIEKPFSGQENIIIPSPKVDDYSKTPEMSAKKITEIFIDKMLNFDFSILNFANPDMIGHTGNLQAAIQACQIVDAELNKIVDFALKNEIILIVIADHGNAEKMIDPKTLEPNTEHTNNKVPFIVFSNKKIELENIPNAGLSNVAPTILKIFNIQKPQEMTSNSLIKNI